MKILVINSGSSSIKYQLFDMSQRHSLAAGIVERIGEAGSRIKHTRLIPQEQTSIQEASINDHRQGLSLMVERLLDEDTGVIQSAMEIAAIGHRVVHGGERFSQPTIITAEVRETIKDLIPLAPLHNPANLTGIEVATELFPQASQVAVFDTAFHQSLPPAAYRYAIPAYLYEEQGIRVYGFHGTSHLYVSKAAAAYLGQAQEETNLITAHLGNGASMTAVRGGQSVDTSMGFSPLAGLIMGTRSGDLDPVVPIYLSRSQNMTSDEIDKLLNKQSGLLGLTGQNDLRDIEDRREQGDSQAQLALDMVAYRIKKYIGAYTAVLGHVDALVFTAGIGEHSATVRRLSCAGLENLGIILDDEKNQAGPDGPVTEIQAAGSPVKILIIPTNEELEIAVQTAELVGREESNSTIK
ncbi:MAG: acetate kinase [Candidatus Promineifilaceae bacterium]|nr:acetate kinase [Candidatus Promineifilaceae bacterium]